MKQLLIHMELFLTVAFNIAGCLIKHVPKCKCRTSLIKVSGMSYACKIKNVLKYLAELRLK